MAKKITIGTALVIAVFVTSLPAASASLSSSGYHEDSQGHDELGYHPAPA
jgi:hypothetical protein